MKKNAIIIIACMLSNLLIAQEIPIDDPGGGDLGGGGTFTGVYSSPTLTPQSPEASNLLKFKETPVDNHTGVPNISIPLVELPGRSMNIPVNLSYHAGGHRVEEEATWVGLGWSLFAGGQITRTVYGLHDDDGGAGFIRNTTTVQDVINDCNSFGYTSNQCQAHLAVSSPNNAASEAPADYQPDVYHFSMMGMSGTFVFSQDRTAPYWYGKIVQFPDDYYEIIPHFSTIGKREILEFRIKDKNGNEYLFEKGNILFNRFSESISTGPSSFPITAGPYTETWVLKKITTSTREQIDFTYEYPNYLGNSNYNEVFSTRASESRVVWDTKAAPGQQSQNTFVTNYTQVQRRAAVLTKIKTDLGEVRFIRSSANRQDTQTAKKRLQYIELRNNHNQLIKKVELVHGYFNSSTTGLSTEYVMGVSNKDFLAKRMYLQSIKFYENDVGSDFYDYNFLYNSRNLPHRRSKAQDHWGYYNGATGNTTLIGYGTISGNRNVNSTYTDARVLETITYPEGGTAKYYYENNVEDNGTDYLGGLRVKQIRYNPDGGGQTQFVSYEYENAYSKGKPEYYSVSTDGTHKYVSQSWVPLLTTQGSYAGYKKVTEKRSTFLASIHLVTHTGSNPPPSNVEPPVDLITVREYTSAGGSFFNEAPYVNGWKAGQLISTSIPDKKLDQNEFQSYNFFSKESKGFVFERECRGDPSASLSSLTATQCEYTHFNNHFVYNLFSGQRLIKARKSYTYEGNQTLLKTDSILYDNINFHYNPTRKFTRESNGDLIETRYQYAKEVNNNALLQRNRINEVISTVHNKGTNVLHATKNDYVPTSNSNYLVSKVSSAKTGSVTAPGYEERLEYHEYDNYGNILEVSQKDGTHIVYIWGYADMLPIAKIENATYSEVYSLTANIQDLSNLDNDRTQGYVGSEGALRQALDNLRNLPALSDAKVTTYTYDPLIGVTSMTDPRGYTLYYNYDGYNRLESVKDAAGHIIKAHQYNY